VAQAQSLVVLACIHLHLEYAATVLDPYQQGWVNTMERVQKFALKGCTKSSSYGYESVLSML